MDTATLRATLDKWNEAWAFFWPHLSQTNRHGNPAVHARWIEARAVLNELKPQLAVAAEERGIDSTPLLAVGDFGWPDIDAAPGAKVIVERLAAKVEIEDGRDRDGTSGGDPEDESLETRALQLLLSARNWRSKSEIAGVLGCSPKALSPQRAPRFHAAWMAKHSPETLLPRGRKSRDGDLEAWEDDE